MIASRPAADRPVPSTVRAALGGAEPTLVWENEAGGLTYRLSGGPQLRFLKWAPAGSGIDLPAEAERLAWAGRFTAVPHVLAQHADETGAWLLTTALPGQNAVSDHWLAHPAVAVRALGAGLRALHDRLPVADCPFSWSVDARVADARRRADAGLLDPRSWHPIHQRLDVGTALRRAADPPPVDRLVVCHGDACAPNTLLGDDGEVIGHVDLGALGVADRWADLAVATWSTEWNYGPGWHGVLLAAYGVAPDPARTAYYRLLWDLGP